jgi:tRNA threonylcarbamoyladenosine modification (KEOPS) complex Cgi121 subunit
MNRNKPKYGDELKLRLPSGREVDTTIEYISEAGEDRIIVFKIDKAVQELIGYRKISLDAIWWCETGKKVPNTAIEYEEKNGEQIPYVIKTVAGYTNKVNIKILKQNEKYAIVDNYKSDELKKLGYTAEEIEDRKTIGLYDEILKNAK